MIYHIVSRSLWDDRPPGDYRPASLAGEGFIHCSHRHQVERIANLFYRDEPELVVLLIDPTQLTSPLRDEDPGTGEMFPHVYGLIDDQAIVQVLPLERRADGSWSWPGSKK
jgi:uncharacterized protein (DUF952 family)